MDIQDIYRSADSHVGGLRAVYAAGYEQGRNSMLPPPEPVPEAPVAPETAPTE